MALVAAFATVGATPEPVAAPPANAVTNAVAQGASATPAPLARPLPLGTVRTTAGATLTGTVAFGPEGIDVRPGGTGESVRVPLDQLVELAVGERPGEAPEAPPTGSPTPAAPAASNPGPAPGAPGWTARAIGSAAPRAFSVEGGTWTVAGGGAGLRGNADSINLVERRLEVSGQLTATLQEFDGTQPEGMAGLMLRDNLGDSAAYAFLGHRTGLGICFQYRQIASGMTMRLTNVVMPLPVGLRLQRMGGSVVAEISTDGRQWTALGRANVNLGQSVRAGVAVTSGADSVVASARFSEPAVGAAAIGYAPAEGYPRVLLRGGSILVAPVDSADESVVRLGGRLRGAVVSLLNVARIEFVALPPDAAARLEPDRPGVLLTDGDFLDATLRRVATNAVTMNSLLYGFRRYAAGSEAAVVQAGAIEPEDAPFRVRLGGGSELRARHLTLGANELRAESPLLGALVVRTEEIRGIRRAGMER